MSGRTAIAAALAVVCGLAAAVGATRLTSAPAAREVETVPVITMSVALPRGVKVGKEHVHVRHWPKNLVVPGAFHSADDVVDRVLLTSVNVEEPLMSSKLAEPGVEGGLTAMIPPGMRAYTISTPDAASGVAGFILPGTRVDVLLTVTDGRLSEAVGGGSTVTLLQNVEVLAVNQELEAPSENRVADQLRSVTLLVTPDQAAKLSLAQSKGTLHLSMRNSQDEMAGETRPMTLKELQFLEEEPAAAPPEPVVEAPPRPPRPVRIMTYRGVSASTVLVHPGGVVEQRPAASTDR